MRGCAVVAILTFAPGLLPAGNKLTWEDRVELTRGLTAEYATVKALLPRSHKPLEFDATSGYDKKQWTEIARESGPAARSGDLVQITKVDIDHDRLVLHTNAGYKGRTQWEPGRRRPPRTQPPLRWAGPVGRPPFFFKSRWSRSRRRRSKKCWRRCWISRS